MGKLLVCRVISPVAQRRKKKSLTGLRITRPPQLWVVLALNRGQVRPSSPSCQPEPLE